MLARQSAMEDSFSNSQIDKFSNWSFSTQILKLISASMSFKHKLFKTPKLPNRQRLWPFKLICKHEPVYNCRKKNQLSLAYLFSKKNFCSPTSELSEKVKSFILKEKTTSFHVALSFSFCNMQREEFVTPIQKKITIKSPKIYKWRKKYF
jgi:hypothetical protein